MCEIGKKNKCEQKLNCMRMKIWPQCSIILQLEKVKMCVNVLLPPPTSALIFSSLLLWCSMSLSLSLLSSLLYLLLSSLLSSSLSLSVCFSPSILAHLPSLVFSSLVSSSPSVCLPVCVCVSVCLVNNGPDFKYPWSRKTPMVSVMVSSEMFEQPS